MTATATLTNQAVAEWIKVFPRQVTANYTSSVAFMKQLTVIAVSTITYLKNTFPEDSYMVEQFGGVKVRILKKTCRDELAQFLSSSLIQAFDAFDKKYLHQLALCFYANECKMENLIEYHIFEYSYNDDGVTMNVHSKNRDNVKHSTKFTFENIRERTIHMIRACVVIMNSCNNELPLSYDVSLRLYYNEAAPIDYQAPGYLPTDESDHLEPTVSEAVKLGCVETPFHKLTTRSYIKEQLEASHEAIPSQNVPMLTNEMELSGSVSTVRLESEVQLQCPCNNYASDYGADELITCDYCRTQQHAICYGLRGPVPRHCCVTCALVDQSRSPTDGKLVGLSSRKRECLCTFRRALDLCSKVSTIEVSILAEKLRLSESNSLKLMKLLYSHGIVQNNPEMDPKSVQKLIPDQVKSVTNKYFNDGDIIERLTGESLSDPIKEVLSPLENITLHTNIQPVAQLQLDPDLEQYKDVLPNEDVDFNTDIENVKKSAKRKLNTLRSGVRTKKVKRSFP